MSIASRPPLFGRVMALNTDHESLARMLRLLGETCSTVDPDGESMAPPRCSLEVLMDWRDELSRHFEAEESDAYFGVIRSDRESLRDAVERLEREHERLLAMSDRMIAMFEARQWSALARMTAQLTALFRAHERLEGTLMREFLQPSE
jgi:hypothetical protein